MALVFQVTNVGLDLLRDASLGAASAQITYVALGTGLTTLTTALTSGTPYTSLTCGALPSALTGGTSLTLVNGTNTQTVTVASGGAAQGATSIPVTSFTASYSFGVGSGIVTTPQLTDVALQDETYRGAVTALNPGSNPGEGLCLFYVPSYALGSATTFTEAAMYGGDASGTAGSGLLVARAVIWFAFTPVTTSGLVTFDYTLYFSATGQ